MFFWLPDSIVYLIDFYFLFSAKNIQSQKFLSKYLTFD